MGEKVRLLTEAIDLFGEAQDWERSLEIISTLKNYIILDRYHSKKLRELLAKENDFLNFIQEGDRFPPTYFVIKHYGADYQKDLLGKEFIYKRPRATKLQHLKEDLLKNYPNVKILYNEPSDSDLKAPGRHVRIFPVNPITELELDGKKIKYPSSWPKNVIDYHQYERPKIFHMSTKYEEKKEKTGSSEASCWVKNTFLFTEEKFPSISIRIKVEKSDFRNISPISNAVASVLEKNEEICKVLENMKKKEYLQDPKKLLDFQRVLSGTVMAGVNGGIFKYKEAFLTTYDPNLEKDEIHKLKLAIQEHLRIVIRGVKYHKKIARRDKLHSQFEIFLRDMLYDDTKGGFIRELNYMRFRKLFRLIVFFIVLDLIWLVYVPNAFKEIVLMVVMTLSSYIGHTILYFVQYIESLIGIELPKSVVYNFGEIAISFFVLVFDYFGQFLVGTWETILISVNIQNFLLGTWNYITLFFRMLKPFVEDYLGDFGILIYSLFSSVFDRLGQEWMKFVISLFF